MKTQSIGNRATLKAAAAEALGGEPTRPPIPQAPPVEAPGLAARRAAFSARDAAVPPGPQPLGNPLFDTPADHGSRAAKVRDARLRLHALASEILTTKESLGTCLAELAADADAVRSAEKFDPVLGLAFINDLVRLVRQLVPEPVIVPDPVIVPEPEIAPEAPAEDS